MPLTFRPRDGYTLAVTADNLAYLPVLTHDLDLAGACRVAAAHGLPAAEATVALALLRLTEAGYLAVHHALPYRPPPLWHGWPLDTGLAALVRCGLAPRLAGLLTDYKYSFRTLIAQADCGFALSDLVTVRGFGRAGYTAFCRAVERFLAEQDPGYRP